MADDAPRRPVYVKYWPPPWRSYDCVYVNMALGVFVPKPFLQSDWPLPVPPYRVYAQSYSSFPPNIPEPPADPRRQSQWPGPIPPYRVYALVTGAYVPLLHSTQPPIRQDKWPPPIQPYRTYSVSSALPLALTAMPFNQEYWPGPTPPYRVYAQSYSTFPSLFPVEYPKNQDDWPKPIEPPRVYAITIRASIDLLHSIRPPITQTDRPPPILPPKVYAQSYSTPLSLLFDYIPCRFTGHLSPPLPYQIPALVIRASIDLLHSIKPPIAQTEWPRPIRPYLVWADSYSTSSPLRGVPPQTFVQSDWPLPVRPFIVYSPARSSNVQLLHSTQPPISQSAWPPPIRPYIVRSESYSTPQSILGVPPQPFAQDDWPAPLRSPYQAPVWLHNNFAIGSDVIPISQLYWPVPAQLQRVYTQSAAPSLALTAKPFGLFDWPAPRRPAIAYTANVPSNVQLLSSGQLVVRQSQWPIPARPYWVRSESYSSSVALLTPTEVPKANFDWPVRRLPYQAPIWIHTNLALEVFDQPFKQAEWPVPRGATYEFGFQHVNLALEEAVPFKQIDWPLPKTVLTPTSIRTWIQKTTALITPPTPLTTRTTAQFPLPKRPYYPPQVSYGTNSTILRFIQLNKPFKQDTWPIPVPPQVSSRSYSQVNPGIITIAGFLQINPDFFEDPDDLYPPQVDVRAPEPTYDFPVGRSLTADYGIRGARRGRYVIGRR